MAGNSIPPTPAAGLWTQRSRRAAASISGRMMELNATSASGMSSTASGRVRALTTSMSSPAARIRSTTQSGVSHATHRL